MFYDDGDDDNFWLFCILIFQILILSFQILFSNGFDYLTSSCKVYNIFKVNLSSHLSTFYHLYSLLIFVINIVVLCLVSSHGQSADLMSIIITGQFSVIAAIIGHTLDVLLLPD